MPPPIYTIPPNLPLIREACCVHRIDYSVFSFLFAQISGIPYLNGDLAVRVVLSKSPFFITLRHKFCANRKIERPKIFFWRVAFCCPSGNTAWAGRWWCVLMGSGEFCVAGNNVYWVCLCHCACIFISLTDKMSCWMCWNVSGGSVPEIFMPLFASFFVWYIVCLLSYRRALLMARPPKV